MLLKIYDLLWLADFDIALDLSREWARLLIAAY
jgi:hypothetical protein